MTSVLISCKTYYLTYCSMNVYLTPSHYLTSKNLHLSFIIRRGRKGIWCCFRWCLHYILCLWCFPETLPILYQLYFIENKTSKALSVLHDVNCRKIWNMYCFFHFPLWSLLTEVSRRCDFSVQRGSSCVNRSLWDQDVKFHCIFSNLGTWCLRNTI